MNQNNNGDMRQVVQRQGYFKAIEAMQTGTYTGDGDIIDYTLWDRFILASTDLIHRLFVNGLGAPIVAGVPKTLADTNVRGNQGMPLGSKLYVRAIKIFYQAQANLTEATYQNILDMLQETTLNIAITGKDTYGQWALDELMGVSMQGIVVPTAAADNYQQTSTGRFVGILPLNLPIVLASQINFEVTVQHWVAPNAALDDDKIKIGLNGILERLS